jgi:hypothetical protein
MKIGLTSIMYNEERFIKPFLKHIPDWVDEEISACFYEAVVWARR